MLTRVYVNNFKAFVNFECRLGGLELLMGSNGSGKSTFVELLNRLQLFSSAGSPIEHCFLTAHATRWQTSDTQEFELDATLAGSDYRYRLQIELPRSPSSKPRVLVETVSHQGSLVFSFTEGEVKLFNNSYQHKVTYPFDWHRSALATIVARSENAKLMQFKDWFANLTVVRVDPVGMAPRSEGEQPLPSPSLSNYASWFRHLAQEEPAEFARLHEDLREALPGLVDLAPKSVGGTARYLLAKFESPSPKGLELGFDELSDGQRALIGLYTLIRFRLRRGYLLCIDEPENFVALPEIQPWLARLSERVEDGDGQALLISHSSELVNQLAVPHGLVFRREGMGPVRVEPFQMEGSVLTPAELVARGWNGH